MADLDTTCPYDSQSPRCAAPPRWLPGLLLRVGPYRERFVHFYQRLRALPRRQRRRLRRRLALTVAAAALLLALSRTPVSALTITVDNGAVGIAADGQCSLVEAIINANGGWAHTDCEKGNLSGADTIVLPAGGLFNVPASFEYYQWDRTGLPVVTTEITIEGHGATIRRAAGADNFRLMAISEMGKLTLKEVTLEGGRSSGNAGGGIRSRGALTIVDSVMRDNTGTAVFAGGDSLTISGSAFEGNDGYDGGAVRSAAAHFSVSDSLFVANTSSDIGAGLLIDGGHGEVAGTTFRDNTVNWKGGGIAIRTGAEVTISRCLISGNTAENGFGGGLYVYESTATVVHSTIADSRGGGISADESVVVVLRSTVSGNEGGGVNSKDGQLTLDNSTVSGNSTPYSGGGVRGYGSEVILKNATVTHNTAADKGGGLWLGSTFYNPFKLTAERALVTGNTAPSGSQIYSASAQNVTVNRTNLFGSNGQSGIVGFTPGATDLLPPAGVLTAHILSPVLGDNGGPTQTHALPAGSLAIDAAPSAACAGQTDQRDVARNLDGDGLASADECDIGAIEFSPLPTHWKLFLPVTRS
ncbi:right-handed parallel beta-helix repeat-containing protein [Promineifilum sp.]|uniref:right-handed parallel beta-helix repeat-containing protein n=1 Tax=Promineifilum sp. TaxID=2664178 RepID=UPI0035B0D5B2